jgi:hypothetical protein
MVAISPLSRLPGEPLQLTYPSWYPAFLARDEVPSFRNGAARPLRPKGRRADRLLRLPSPFL